VIPYKVIAIEDVLKAVGDPAFYRLVPAMKPLYARVAAIHRYLRANGMIDEHGKLLNGPGCVSCRGRIVLQACREIHRLFCESYFDLWKRSPESLAGASVYFDAETVALPSGDGQLMEA
jgi:hypothetical protein